jgi:hypothetical protein
MERAKMRVLLECMSVDSPCQNGELTETARRWGTYSRSLSKR